ncbi:MAG TPA: flagellar cap protein FliD N-terminal domain-containing protein, partial [Bryobacteraceae bacterium]|nr:flagellar cap protein FliD N-terminal domain-containing protein [Bryobacteraceae bacterium]
MSVSASIGPISGIDYGSLINGLIALDQEPIDQLSTRLGTMDQQNNALTSLSTQMTALKISAASFSSTSIFRSATATSANPSVVTATAGVGTPTGTYSFNVQRLASASQMVTQGFSNTTTALGLSG